MAQSETQSKLVVQSALGPDLSLVVPCLIDAVGGIGLLKKLGKVLMFHAWPMTTRSGLVSVLVLLLRNLYSGDKTVWELRLTSILKICLEGFNRYGLHFKRSSCV